MRLPLEWIEEFRPLPAPVDEVAARLALSGLEIESIERSVLPAGIVAVQIIDCTLLAGSNASLCRLDAGGHGVLSVVCGASNASKGMLVPLALPGTELGNKRVEVASIQGIESQGMLCSERELGLGESHAGLLELRRAEGFSPGVPLRDCLPDTLVLDFAITPNRGDCASVLGVAREIGALWGLGIDDPAHRPVEVLESDADWRAGIEAREGCGWYTLQIFEGQPASAVSPLKMRRRLHQAAIRAIHPVVDVTNFVMLERGQPLHAFDAARLEGKRLSVRWGRSGEVLRLLDGTEVRLIEKDLVIADSAGAVALAGVMGGASSEVNADTRGFVLESAAFTPAAVRRTARRAGRSSEASFRFERGVDPSGAARASWRAAELLSEIGIERTGPIFAAGGAPAALPSVPVSVPALQRLLGLDCDRPRMAAHLQALGVEVEIAGADDLIATPPPWRFDLKVQADFAEEVARLEGYDAIPETLPRITARCAGGSLNGNEGLRGALRAHGFAEAVTLAFSTEARNLVFAGLLPEAASAVQVANPISSETGELRRSMLPGLLEVVRLNQSRGASFVPVFGIGRIFCRPSEAAECEERRSLGLVVAGVPPSEMGKRPEAPALTRIRAIVDDLLLHLGVRHGSWRAATSRGLHPGRCAEIVAQGSRLGLAGAIDPRAAAAFDISLDPLWLVELDLDCTQGMGRESRRYRPLPRFPAIRRDVALVVAQGLSAAELLAGFESERLALVESVELFDEYSGPGVPKNFKSLAVSISYRADERTLTDDEVAVAHEQLLEALRRRIEFERR